MDKSDAAPPESKSDRSIDPQPEESDGQDALRSTVDLLRDQVDALQVQVHEPSRPWYKQVSIWISLTALIGTALSYAIDFYWRADERRSDAEERMIQTVHESILELLSTDQEAIAVMSRPASAQRDASDQLLNAKRLVLISLIEELIGEVEGRISSSTLNVFGTELANNSEFEKAEKYFLKSREKCVTILDCATVHMRLAQIYANPKTPLHDAEQATSYWIKAVSKAEESQDDYGVYITIQSLVYWAMAERAYGNEDKANELFDRAAAKVDGIHRLNPLRVQAAGQIESARRQDENQLIVTHDRSLTGTWDILYPSNHEKRGRLIVQLNPASNQLHATADVYMNDELHAKWQGVVRMMGTSTAHIDWAGAIQLRPPRMPGAIAPQPVMGQAIGSIMLDLVEDADHWQGTEHQLGQPSVELRLVREPTTSIGDTSNPDLALAGVN